MLRQLHPGGHAGVHEARLHGDDVYPRLCQAIAQAGQEGREAGLGRTVDVIRRPAAVARDRRDADHHPVRGHPLDERSHDAGRPDVVRLHDLRRGVGIALGHGLVAHVADHADDDAQVRG